MEKFKAVEKEMKVKAFSKEGLSAAAKLDPKEKEKADTGEFLEEMIEALGRQIEAMEAEQETLQGGKKGKKGANNDRIEEIKKISEKHEWHRKNLELLLRAVQNDSVEPSAVETIKEDIKYYIEENENVGFFLDEDDTLYDDFNLEADEAAWGAPNEIERVSSHDAPSVADENNEPPDSNKITKQKSASTTENASLANRRPSNTFKTTQPVLTTIHTPLANVTNTATPAPMKPAPPPARPPGETLKYASAAAAAAAADKAIIAPLPPPPGTLSTPLLSHTVAVQPESSKPSPAVSAALPAKASKAPSLAAASPTVSQAATGSIPPTPALETSEPVSKGKATAPLETAPEEPEEVSSEPSEPETPPPVASTGVATVEDVEPIFHLPECLSDLVAGFSDIRNLIADPTAPQVQRLLNLSYEHGGHVSDFEKPSFYRPAVRYNVPSHYPQDPSTTFDDPSMFERLDNDLLFFQFYYNQGTWHQHQAAKALKTQSWRFHKQYQTWFQRHEEPKQIHEDYEQGTYRFFDYESTW